MSNSSIGSTDNDFGNSVTVRVVQAVAAERSVEPTELPPLYRWIDPDALNALFESTDTGRTGHLEFAYDGQTIVVDCEETISISVEEGSEPDPVLIADEGEPRTKA